MHNAKFIILYTCFFSLALSPLTGNALRAPLANHQLLVPTDKGEGKGKREKGKGKRKGSSAGPRTAWASVIGLFSIGWQAMRVGGVDVLRTRYFSGFLRF